MIILLMIIVYLIGYVLFFPTMALLSMLAVVYGDKKKTTFKKELKEILEDNEDNEDDETSVYVIAFLWPIIVPIAIIICFIEVFGDAAKKIALGILDKIKEWCDE